MDKYNFNHIAFEILTEAESAKELGLKIDCDPSCLSLRMPDGKSAQIYSLSQLNGFINGYYMKSAFQVQH